MNKKTYVKTGFVVVVILLLLSMTIGFLIGSMSEGGVEQDYDVQCVGDSFVLVDNVAKVSVPSENLDDFYCGVKI